MDSTAKDVESATAGIKATSAKVEATRTGIKPADADVEAMELDAKDGSSGIVETYEKQKFKC